MIRKERIRTAEGPRTRVTFVLPEQLWAETVHLVGDFNGWSRTAHPFGRDREGRWWIAVELADRRTYRFRYLVDGGDWLSDGQAAGWPATGAASAFIVNTLLAAEDGPGRARAAAPERSVRAVRTQRGLPRAAPVPLAEA
jgi:hypothetical protein